MKNIFILLAAVLISTECAHAQSFFKQLSRFELMCGGEYLTLVEKMYFNGQETPGRGHTEELSTFSIGAAINFPILEFSPDLSLGVATGFDGGFVRDESGSSGSDMDGNGIITSNETSNSPYKFGILNLPLVATFKYGGDATLHSLMKFGAGVGIGYQRTYFFVNDLTYNLPVISPEISYGNQTVVKLRATIPLQQYKPDANTTIIQYNFSVGVIGLF